MVENRAGQKPAPLILVANDQEWTARSIESVLVGAGYQVERAYTGRQAIDKALTTRPDAIVLDRQLPDIDGVAVCRNLRSGQGIADWVPVVITTAGPSGRAERLAALEAGAWDFVGQPLDAELFVARLRSFLAARPQLTAPGLIDPETGLYNQAGFTRRTRELGREACRRRDHLGAVAIDASRCQEQPQTSHSRRLAGIVADTLMQTLRGADVIGRVAALEFAVLLPLCDHLGIRPVVDRIQGALRQTVGAWAVDAADLVKVGTAVAPSPDPQSGDWSVDLLVQEARIGASA